MAELFRTTLQLRRVGFRRRRTKALPVQKRRLGKRDDRQKNGSRSSRSRPGDERRTNKRLLDSMKAQIGGWFSAPSPRQLWKRRSTPIA
jgi:hypothetical protein